MCYYHPFMHKWQRKRRIINWLLFWSPIACIAFLIFYVVWFVSRVAA